MNTKSDLLRRRTACVLCSGVRLPEVLRLPATPPANEFVREREPQDKFSLTLQLCGDCGHLQLAEVLNPVRLFANYVYVSGTSPVFVAHFARMVETLVARLPLHPLSYIVDIGSNDGTLLKAWQRFGFTHVEGIEPAASIAKTAREAGVPTLTGFFNLKLALELRATRGPATVITANNVFAHADDLDEFIRGVRELLAPEGEFVFEVSYLGDVLKHTLFDTIYHEHLSYHAVGPLVPCLASVGLHIYDVERIVTHGGSIRVYASRARKHKTAALESVLADEYVAGLFDADTYRRFAERIETLGVRLRATIGTARAAGKRVCGFGAPAKLTTLMYSLRLEPSDFEFIIDDSPWKQGLYTPGYQIEVVTSEALYTRTPDICVIFAWNFFDSIRAKHATWEQAGGVFINPLA